MRRVKHFGFSDDDWDEDVLVGNFSDLYYMNMNGKEFWFHLEPGGIGYELYDYQNDIDYEYATLEEMFNKHIMPDGVPMIDVWNGENFRMDEK